MPMLDVFIPDGAITPDAEEELVRKLTDLLLKHEGADPENERARGIAWVFVHNFRVYVGGEREREPHYRVIGWVPEGQYDPERRRLMTEEATEAVLDAEQGVRPRDPARVWVFTEEVPDGTWGWDARIMRLGDIAGYVMNDDERGQDYAQRRLAKRRSAREAEMASTSG